MVVKRLLKKKSEGFTLIEMIAAMVLVSILVPGISSILGGTLMNIALTQIAVLANMEADYAQRNFIKHINGVEEFSDTADDLNTDILKFTSYLGNADYAYYIDTDGSRTIKYSKDGNPDDAGILLQNVVKDTTINAVRYVSKFTYKDKNNNNLSVPVASSTEVHGVELTFYLLRGESFYSYTTYAAIDKGQLDI